MGLVRRSQRVAFSFNGGKDSTVLLHLLRAAMEQTTGSAGERTPCHAIMQSRTDTYFAPCRERAFLTAWT